MPWSSNVPEVVLGPGLPPERHLHLQAGCAIELHRPDGTVIRTEIAAVLRGAYHAFIVLPRLIRLDDVPSGTEAWQVEAAAKRL
jgi:hypothetical protein